MDPMEAVGYLLAVLMGMVLGVLGGGGSILTVPLLVYVFGLSAERAAGASLFIVGSVALIGASSALRRGQASFREGVAFALPSSTGVVFSRKLILPRLPDPLWEFHGMSVSKDTFLLGLFAAVLVAAAWFLLRDRTSQREGPAGSVSALVLSVIAAFGIGLLAGMIGAGGGFLIVPSLVALYRMEMRRAVGTSLAIISVQSLVGFVAELSVAKQIPWGVLLGLLGSSGLGLFVALRWAPNFSERALRRGFAVLLILLGSAIAGQQILRSFTGG